MMEIVQQAPRLSAVGWEDAVDEILSYDDENLTPDQVVGEGGGGGEGLVEEEEDKEGEENEEDEEEEDEEEEEEEVEEEKHWDGYMEGDRWDPALKCWVP